MRRYISLEDKSGNDWTRSNIGVPYGNDMGPVLVSVGRRWHKARYAMDLVLDFITGVAVADVGMSGGGVFFFSLSSLALSFSSWI
mmetsp:Transcript_2858/g.3977  ORF Transcript_2858/g.3977 Transcript_2858/m.3977 type:complete len:85 (-) Transcript_2858:480-734(-)